jgi:catechol 2,3-dioxygenase
VENFDIIRVASVTMNVTDLNKARHFYVDTLGFIETAADDNHLYLRGLEEHVHHSLILKKGEQPGVHCIAYKVRSEDDLHKIQALFASKGLPFQWISKGEIRAVGRTLQVIDPSGIPLQFFCEMETVERMLQRYDMYKGARVQRIDHVNCSVSDVQKAYDFYRNELGFRCSEYTATESDEIWAAWLFRKPTVHDQAFMNGKGPRLHHVGFWLSDPMSLIHTCDVLASVGYSNNIERGPGRHGLSNAFFLYIRDPDGNRLELYNGDYLTCDPDFKPIRWELDDPRRQTFWGHEAPDSWFNEATPFLDFRTGKHIPQEDGKLKQRKSNFII